MAGRGLVRAGHHRVICIAPLRAELLIHIRKDWKANPGSAEELVGNAAAMLREGGPGCLTHFDPFPAPVSATDKLGAIIYFNPACVDFAGRTPRAGVDRWCVSWKLHDDDGAELPHDQCPMAVVVREGRRVRGVEVCAERPDGALTRFRPFPTPAIDEDGSVMGAVNLLVPVDGDAERKLLATATKCRNLAKWVSDNQASETLKHMADECEGQAAVLRLD